jgi:hypothetical protein
LEAKKKKNKKKNIAGFIAQSLSDANILQYIIGQRGNTKYAQTHANSLSPLTHHGCTLFGAGWVCGSEAEAVCWQNGATGDGTSMVRPSTQQCGLLRRNLSVGCLAHVYASPHLSSGLFFALDHFPTVITSTRA